MTADDHAPLESPGFRYEPRVVRTCPHEGCEWSATTEALITRDSETSTYLMPLTVFDQLAQEHLETHLDPSVRYR